MSPALIIGFIAFGVASGALAGLLGVGGGAFMVPMLTLVAGLSQHAAQGTSLAAIVPTSVAASIVLARRGVGDLTRALQMGVVGAAGAVGGSTLALALPASTLRMVFAVFLAGTGARLIRDARRTAAAPPA
jgi:uncharacterized membrane protein YfcA